MMKIINLLLVFVFLNLSNANATECLTALQKLKPSCNVIGKSYQKLKVFSKKHKTINGSSDKKGQKKLSLKEFSKKHKTIGDTLKSMGKKK